jgi:HKD family nuclease
MAEERLLGELEDKIALLGEASELTISPDLLTEDGVELLTEDDQNLEA